MSSSFTSCSRAKPVSQEVYVKKLPDQEQAVQKEASWGRGHYRPDLRDEYGI